MTGHRAFTLVELLVVIAIIALLISILAPSLKVAKELAKQTICATNLRAAGMSMVVYSAANKNTLPLLDVPARPYQATVCFGSQGGQWVVNPETGVFFDVRRWGLVYSLKILGPPEMFYCPSSIVPMYRLDTYGKPWGAVPPPPPEQIGTGFIRGGYMMCPNVDDSATKYSTGIYADKFPGDKPLATDVVESGAIAHLTGTIGKWYMVFIDGHVETRTSKKATATLQSAADVSYWPQFNKSMMPDLLMEK
jgi:prepilin-type N-terminal cleavage/methylation domain-containing protein